MIMRKHEKTQRMGFGNAPDQIASEDWPEE